ncbi:MAG: dephospho-CoA kinase [Bacteroidales bacterium]|nr:dephospho-CoA kinase [Bacteroidales bacterium]
MKIIGLTGGIGSGKTTVSQIFAEYGVPIFCCDSVAKDIQDTDPIAIQGIKEMFGSHIYSADGILNRRRIASIVFADTESLARLNSLIHPLVHQRLSKFAAQNAAKPLVLMESAILIQSGFYRQADFCVHVSAPLDTRICRVMQRDHATREQVLARIKNQMPDEEMAKHCKYQIINEELDSAKSQVKAIIEKEEKIKKKLTNTKPF